jgi:hypothetical protein
MAPGKIHSLEDIRLEKLRLRMEILKTETNIHQGYRDILDALSFRNIATTMINDVTASSTLISKALSYGKTFIEKRRKKKHDKMMAENSEAGHDH